MEAERPVRRAGIARRRKIALACEPCRERKSRCDGHKPMCSSCVRRALPLSRCVYKVENLRSACGYEYVQALHQRILELERCCSAAASSTPEEASNHAVPISGNHVSEAGSGGGPAVEPGTEPNDPSETQSITGQHSKLQQPSIEAQCNAEAQNSYAKVQDPRNSIDSASHVTGMGALINASGDGSSSSQRAQYFGSSSTASLMDFLAHDTEQQGHREMVAPQRSSPYKAIGESQLWSRDTPSVAQSNDFVLPPRDFADHLLGCFWDRVYCMYPFFDRSSFQKAYENLWMPTHRAIHQTTALNVGLGDRMNSGPTSIVFNCALNTMFALGCHLTDLPIQDRETTVYQFFLQAKHHIGLDMIDIHSIGVVQTLLIVALFLQSTPYPHRCWNSIGTACRLALGLGLHDAQLEKSKDPLEREIHRRTWHGCVMLDMTVSMTYGRPSMTAHLKSVPLPGGFDLRTRQVTEEFSLAAFYVWTIKLYSILDTILADVYKAWHGRSSETTPRAQQPEIDTIVQLENQLLQYQFSIPPHLSWTEQSPLASKSLDHSILNRQRNVLH
ncbi:hypothetical protein N7513_003638 [Penicillium frequentans]|nr:hypothetical protein N7513_003638 [Penicillium glabrum]